MLVANEIGATNDLWHNVLWTFAEAFHKVLKRNGDNVSHIMIKFFVVGFLLVFFTGS